jgi:uncharacterized protein YdeI (YjbR/CyaY-like superfamily)
MDDPLPFPDRPALRAWFDAHHATEPELLVLGYKVATRRPSVTWEDCVIEALRVGWIDGVRRGIGPEAWVQRLTPRRPRSSWSARNVAHAERLIAAGEMTPAGLAQVEAARADGRWAAAYAGPAALEIPADFLRALETRPLAKAMFATLNRQNLYAIYHRLHTARTPETRARRMEALLATLDRGERFH